MQTPNDSLMNYDELVLNPSQSSGESTARKAHKFRGENARGKATSNPFMVLALAAYAAYLINAVQFVLKLRAARLGAQTADASDVHSGVAA